jgi:hypothetical protein
MAIGPRGIYSPPTNNLNLVEIATFRRLAGSAIGVWAASHGWNAPGRNPQ